MRRCDRFTCRSPSRLVLILLAGFGFMVAGCGEEAESPTGPAADPEFATAAAALTFSMVTTGGIHSCGLASDGRAYCWGGNTHGELGDGTTINRTRPVPVKGGLHFSAVSAGDGYTCGLTTEQRAYCWGWNDLGMLGNGTRVNRTTPVAVKGGLVFRQIRPGSHHTCAVTTTAKGYCWGSNENGKLGIGASGGYRLVPIAVAGGLNFRRIIPGGGHTCGLTTSGKAYCWGGGNVGQIGDGQIVLGRPSPKAVSGGLTFTQVVAGEAHSCGVTSDKRAYCWGDNSEGALGDGTTADKRLVPTLVAGGLFWNGVSTLSHHTCGVASTHRVWCWGYNLGGGQTGVDPRVSPRVRSPQQIPGGISFSAVGGGLSSAHTCAVTGAGAAYCWGGNFAGQLGDGTTTTRFTPKPVVGPT
jgi:alpha-tubulin suppressor-like RCC1 family protein